MPDFIPLEELRRRVWPLALVKHLATDATGISLPILDYEKGNTSHPYQVVFLLYYAVTNMEKKEAPANISRAYAWITLDMQTGGFIDSGNLITENEPKPLIGPGVRQEVQELSDEDRRNLQDLFFSRCNEVARIYASGNILTKHMEYLTDLIGLYEYLMEPPLKPDYENVGKKFFSWLRMIIQGAPPPTDGAVLKNNRAGLG
jgi:hypothetical protein